MIELRYTLERVGFFWEVFDNAAWITVFVTEERDRAIAVRNYLNGTAEDLTMVPVELIEPQEEDK